MKQIFTIILAGFISTTIFAQGITLPPSGGNQKAEVSQWIGPVKVTINYSSPKVHAPDGTDRKGHIWRELVPYGLNNLGFGTSTAAPWRAGANENTTITFSHDVKLGGKDVKAGTYGLHLIVEKDVPWTYILSNNSTSWGSFFYDAKEDAARVQSTPVDSEYSEYLTYGFEDRHPNSAVAYLAWENKKAPITIEVPNINELYVASMRDELRGSPGFNFQNYASAANFCATNKINLEEALTWADAAISGAFVGQENFFTLQTKANVLNAMGKSSEAESVMMKAINHPTASVGQIHGYGRSLITAGKNEKALEVFKTNQKLHPEDKFTPNVGLARGYNAVGDKKNAIKYWELAIKNIPENQKPFLTAYQDELKKVKEGN
ncbi:MAG TPA: DUF2911 domain-containing protein [Cyclobacteriaceae bacterium]|nr:DUF2911 domain-containing protein [Cyclobacteriaceae bacterium]